jgi:hypothetical protein
MVNIKKSKKWIKDYKIKTSNTPSSINNTLASSTFFHNYEVMNMDEDDVIDYDDFNIHDVMIDSLKNYIENNKFHPSADNPSFGYSSPNSVVNSYSNFVYENLLRMTTVLPSSFVEVKKSLPYSLSTIIDDFSSDFTQVSAPSKKSSFPTVFSQYPVSQNSRIGIDPHEQNADEACFAFCLTVFLVFYYCADMKMIESESFDIIGKIAIITFYRHQVELISVLFGKFNEYCVASNALKKEKGNNSSNISLSSIECLSPHPVLPEICTIDEYQGRQSDIIIFSTVNGYEERHPTQFMRDERRINVGTSRARGYLLIYLFFN